LVILPEGTKPVTIEADSMHNLSSCATEFHLMVPYINDWGSKTTKWEAVAQYPTDRLIIESIEYECK
jgi:hypothetical protein